MDVVVWKGDWKSGYPGVTGTMAIPLYDDFTLEYTTYCDTTYTGWYKNGDSFRIVIEVLAPPLNAQYPVLVSQNGDQTITYTVEKLKDGTMSGMYVSETPSDCGTFKMSRVSKN
jgi:hypothetical protein